MPTGRFTVPSLWLLTILLLGTSYLAIANTVSLVLPLLKLLAPAVSIAKLHAIHMALRKLAHLTEYAILALLWFRALRWQAPRAAAWSELAVCLICAIADEMHRRRSPRGTAACATS